MEYTLSTTWTLALVALAIWELTWKAIALWKSAQNNQRVWFLTILIVNSIGVLPIVYLLQNRSHATRAIYSQPNNKRTSAAL